MAQPVNCSCITWMLCTTIHRKGKILKFGNKDTKVWTNLQKKSCFIPAYRIMTAQHIAFLTTKAGYESYVEYWNEKLRTIDKYTLS